MSMRPHYLPPRLPIDRCLACLYILSYILPGFINYKFDDYTHIQYLRIDFGFFGGSAAKCMLIVLLYFCIKAISTETRKQETTTHNDG